MTAPAQLRFRHVVLPTADISDRLRFFRALGFELVFSKSDADVHPTLQQMGDGTCFVEQIRNETTPDPSEWPRGLSVDHLASAIDMLAKDRLHRLGPFQHRVSGGDFAFFKDWSGNLIEITAAIA